MKYGGFVTFDRCGNLMAAVRRIRPPSLPPDAAHAVCDEHQGRGEDGYATDTAGRKTGWPPVLFPLPCSIRATLSMPRRQRMNTTPARSALMSRVRQHGTYAEDIVRRALSMIGARFRLNVKALPGRPDIANKSRKKAIFVHGCFWHHHGTCGRGKVPARNREFWENKLRSNIERDERKERELNALGYSVLVVWECELNDPVGLESRLRAFWFGGAAAET